MDNKQVEQAPKQFIKCQCGKCGNSVFVQGKILAPGDERPSVIKKVWVCIGCGMIFEPEDFPKKGDNDRRESKLLLPDSNKKLTLIQ